MRSASAPHVHRTGVAHDAATAALATPRLRVVAATIALNVIAVALLTLAPWSDWRTGLALNLVDNAILLAFVVRHRDVSLLRLMLFGVVVGIAELPADALLVDVTKTLDYTIGGGPMLWRSPLWMPLAWQIVAVQFAVVGGWLWERLGGTGLAATAVLGAINIPYYEELARPIHWWTYRACRMVSATPWYIIVGEAGIAVALAVLGRRAQENPIGRTTITTGALAGAAILTCYGAAWWAIDGRVG